MKTVGREVKANFEPQKGGLICCGLHDLSVLGHYGWRIEKRVDGGWSGRFGWLKTRSFGRLLCWLVS